MRGMTRHWRYLIYSLWLTGWAVPAFRGSHKAGIGITDWDVLRFGSKALVGIEHFYPHPALHVYHEYSWLQVGPPAVFISGLAQLLFGRHGGYGGDVAVLVLIMLAGLGCVAVLERFAARSGRQRLVMIAAVPFLAVWATAFGRYGHPEDAFAILAILTAALLAESRPGWLVGLLLGFGVACKPWAVVAVPLILAVPGRRQQAHAVALMVLTAALPWLPFFAADHGTVLEFNQVWSVAAGTPLHLLLHGQTPIGWRLLQLGAAVAVGGLVTTRRGDWRLGLLAAFAVKALLEPGWYSYYGVAPIAVAVLVDLSRSRRVPVWTCGALALWCVLPLLFGVGVVTAVSAIGWAALVLTVGLRPTPASRTPRTTVDLPDTVAVPVG